MSKKSKEMQVSSMPHKSLTTNRLPMLYSRRSDGGIQQWVVEVEGDKYRTISGIKDGNLVISEWTVALPKNVGKANETSGSEQALKEAKADWTKKVEKGYFEDLTKIDQIAFIEPMLAKEWNPETLKYPVFSEPKLDGVRMVARKEGLFSRSGKPFVSCPHIEEALKPYFVESPGLILDGELYTSKYSTNFNAICEAVKRTNITPETLKLSRVIQYHIYDIPSNKDKFSLRKITLENLIKPNDILVLVPTTKVNNQKELDKCYEGYLEEGYEGQMIRLDEVYEIGKRSKYLLKRKEFTDCEYKVLDIEEGVGNRSGTAGAFIMELKPGVTFRSNVKGDREYVAKLLREKPSIKGKMATIKYFNLTPDGVPRFPYVVAIRDYE